MSRDWESVFRSWANPPSDSEEQRCENADRMVRDAIGRFEGFKARNVNTIPQGSYNNNTNVRLNSDVDICVRCTDTFFFELPKGMTKEQSGISDATYRYPQFKNEVESALVDKFGRSAVKRGNKAFDIVENTYHIAIDVVACFEYRYYYMNSRNVLDYISGVKFIADDGKETINYPRQHYEQGVSKNNATNHRYKYMVRGLKRLRNEMADTGIAAAKPIPSYLIECLVWNCPNGSFGHTAYADDVRSILSHTYNSTTTREQCKEWLEVNNIKYLFHWTQPWTYSQAHEFLGAAWNYIGFN